MAVGRREGDGEEGGWRCDGAGGLGLDEQMGCEGGEGEGGERAGDGAVRQWGGGRAMGRNEGGDGDGTGGLGLDEHMI